MRRDRRVEASSSRRIGIHVGGDIDAALASRRNFRDDLGHELARLRLIGGLQVKDLDLDTRLLANADRFIDR